MRRKTYFLVELLTTHVHTRVTVTRGGQWVYNTFCVVGYVIQMNDGITILL